MAPSNSFSTYQMKPKVPFEAEYNLSPAGFALLPPVNNTYLLCYEGASSPSDQANLVDRLQASLQSFLCEPQDGVLALPEILGKNDVTYKQLGPEIGFCTPTLKREIFATGVDVVAMPDQEHSVDAFSCQVTFTEGGFVIGVSKHHYVCDGTAISNFIKWWFKKARSYGTDKVVPDSEIVPESKMMTLHDRSSLLLKRQVEPQERRESNGVHGSSAMVSDPKRVSSGSSGGAA